jgi:hypothetical protein
MAVLQAAVAAKLPFLRAEAEALMVDTFEVGDYGDGYEYDEDTGITTRTFNADFTSKGRLLTNTAPGESEAGERTVVSISRTLHLPISTPVVTVGKVARRTSDGAEFRVLADITHPQPKSRKLAVEQVLS